MIYSGMAFICCAFLLVSLSGFSISVMTEKEKAAKGLLYDANNDPELQREMLETHCRVAEYNNLPLNNFAERDKLLRTIINAGCNCTVISPFFCDYGYNITVGDNFFANVNLVVLDGAKVTIGNNVFVAPNVGIYTAGHPLDAERRNAGLEYARPVTIGDNVWIGAGVSILPGVTIGNNSVIGAGSVVVRDVPPYAVAVGNPCRVIKKIDDGGE